MDSNKVQYECFKAWLENNIFFIVYETDTFSLKVVEKALEARLELSKGLAFPMLSDIRSIKSANIEARKFIAEPENNKLLTAGALLVDNQFQKVVGNLFILIEKPPVPAKLFTDKNEAIGWLQQYKAI